jgi:hypothetical protein
VIAAFSVVTHERSFGDRTGLDANRFVSAEIKALKTIKLFHTHRPDKPKANSLRYGISWTTVDGVAGDRSTRRDGIVLRRFHCFGAFYGSVRLGQFQFASNFQGQFHLSNHVPAEDSKTFVYEENGIRLR